MNILELYPDKFVVDPVTNCWLFTGYLNKKGYGKMKYRYNLVSVHRLSAHLSLDLILADKTVHALHKLECPNKNCANFEHLYLGNDFDNQRDAIHLGHTVNPRRYLTHCKYGHPLSGDNLYIPKDGRRRCNQCRKDNSKRHYEQGPQIKTERT